MRALCESCQQPQPADWRPGDICIHCGQPVRQQVRCYWCSHWIPAGNFCRLCGAEGIAPDLYAAARMVRFYGADMFSIPKMLREMDPARLDTFRSIYGQHLSIAMRHVEELRELERELFHQAWSSAFEEELISQLPWREDSFALYSKPASSPFSLFQTLAPLIALRQGDFSLLHQVGGSLSGLPADLQLETALQLANWRVAGNTYLENLRYPVLDILRRTEPKTLLVRLSLAYLSDYEIPAEALTSGDQEESFFAALLLGNEPILIRALDSPNPLQRMVAANKLIRLGRGDGVVQLFAQRADVDQQQSMVNSILLAKRAVPELHSALFDAIAHNPASKLSRTAATSICLGCSHSEAMRLADTLDWDILHCISLAKSIEPDTYRQIGEMLVRRNMVSMSQYFWSCVTRMPQDFVERAFALAGNASIQIELLRFAEKQADQLPRGTPMERVLIYTAFSDNAPEVIGAAWACLHRINYHREYGSPSPFPYTYENITQYWTYPEFELRLKDLQSNAAALEETFVAEDLRRFLGSKVADSKPTGV